MIPLRSVAVLALFAPAGGAQDQELTPPRRVVVCDLGRQEPWLVRMQASDGRFPAVCRPSDPAAESAAESGGDPLVGEPPPSERDLRVTALGTLALLGDGSTMRAGPDRDAVKRAVRWLLDRRDAAGRMGLHAGPDWILDHAMATYALCEAARLSSYSLMRERIAAPLAVLADHLRRFEAGVDAELLVWCRMCARSATKFESWWNERPAAATERWDSGAAILDAHVARLIGTAVIDSRRARAARLLLEALAEGPLDASALDRLATPFVADGWPQDVGEPLAVLYGCLALYRLTGRERGEWAMTWKDVTARLTEALVETQNRSGELSGTWEPQGAFGAEFGRVGVTATHCLTLELYYRYSRLEAAN